MEEKEEVEEKMKCIKLGKGCLIGVSILSSLLKSPEASWEWVDETVGGVASLGAVSQITVLASSDVNVTYFTTFEFEKMFNSCLSLFGGNEIAQYIKEKKEMVESLGIMSSKHENKKDHDPPPRVDEAIEKGEDPREEPSEAQREGKGEEPETVIGGGVAEDLLSTSVNSYSLT
eukprot:CAMPEP_0119040190 /NCGR_PEP_ID=MMETSP1177-20130426/10042_1 /TAXON_ID=2985 /ORGANISM="Ochromonas sp, Strain CCMP1899" /LENGTH=173 /DNA_ID=CAMNT_0007004993 /DNA_START=447 /DNA_END=968 /DNA_ORIENTATION=+